jgi:T5SS/PEP-CTERM-associated repeat protein
VNSAGQQLSIQGGQIDDIAAYVGYNSSSSSNIVLVRGPGSVWSNSAGLYLGYYGPGNRLTITNSGSVGASLIQIGTYPGGDGTLTLSGGTITSGSWFSLGTFGGTGTVFMTGGQLNVPANNLAIGERPGSAGQMFMSGGIVQVLQLHIAGNAGTNATGTLTFSGGTITSGDLKVGMSANSTGTVVVTGGYLADSGSLVVGASGSSGNSLTITNGGYIVCGAGGAIGASSGSSNNTVVVAGGGSLVVTNAADNAPLVVSQAGGADSLILNGGSVTANQLVLTNGANSVFTFSAGTLSSGGTSVTNNQVFVVGDGTDAATFQLNGGLHSFANNLEISSNAFLTGCGTIEGNVTIDPGGTVLANCGGTLTFTGIVTNNGTMQAVDGSVLQAYGPVVNNGLIIAITGSTEFLGGLGGNGCLLTESDVQVSSITRSGTNITVQIPSVTCATYQLQVTPSLKPATWTSLGAPQNGTGGVLTFTDTGGATNRPGRFYRIDITLP